MARVTNRAVFNDALLPQGRSRAGSFGAGFGLELIVLAAIILIPLLLPQKMDYIQRYLVTPIATPPIMAWKPQPPPKPEIVKRPVATKETPKLEVVELPKPKIYNPVVTAPVAKPKIRSNAPEMPEVAKVFSDPSAMSLGSSAIPTLKKPREPVQTGGFGDPDGLPANHETKRSPNAAQLGAYDMPTGAGKGNGTGGSKGIQGVVASAGFGNDVATGDSNGRNHAKVHSAGFGDEETAVAAPRIRPTSDSASRTRPVEILFKPQPVYTQEATAKRIEGDVILQVTFTSSGHVVVQRIVQGLGYGLDESAEAAARQIRFHPAQQDGQSIDSTVNVRITFELAY